MNGYVYIFLRGDGLRKLGWTTNLERRNRQHTLATGFHHENEMAWNMGSRAAHKVEQIAHRSLHGLSCAWSREVYNLPLSRLVDAVESARAQVAREMPGGLTAIFPPRASCVPNSTRSVIIEPPNWAMIIPEVAAYLDANPELFAAMMSEYTKIGLRLADHPLGA